MSIYCGLNKMRRMESRRKQRLVRKVQKAHAVELLGEVMARPTWNKRFRAVQAMRASDVATAVADRIHTNWPEGWLDVYDTVVREEAKP